jgi:hypothetical protein
MLFQEVYIKQFSSFHSCATTKIMRVQSDGKIHLFRATEERWSRQRHAINLPFSSAKLADIRRILKLGFLIKKRISKRFNIPWKHAIHD